MTLMCSLVVRVSPRLVCNPIAESQPWEGHVFGRRPVGIRADYIGLILLGLELNRNNL